MKQIEFSPKVVTICELTAIADFHLVIPRSMLGARRTSRPKLSLSPFHAAQSEPAAFVTSKPCLKEKRARTLTLHVTSNTHADVPGMSDNVLVLLLEFPSGVFPIPYFFGQKFPTRSTRECWSHHLTCGVLKPQRFENYSHQDKVLQPRVCADKAGNGSNGMTACLLVKSSHF